MPRRIKSAMARLRDRMVHNTFAALVIGIGTNFLYDFLNLKLDTGGASRFSKERIIEYGFLVRNMLLDHTRIEVGFSAVIIFALVMSMPIYFWRLWIMFPLEVRAGIDDEDLTWREYRDSFHLRILYWSSFLTDKVVISWAGYLAFLAHNPNKPLSWLKFMQNVRSPVRIMSDADNYPGVFVALLVASVMASVYHNKVRPIREHYARNDRSLKKTKK